MGNTIGKMQNLWKILTSLVKLRKFIFNMIKLIKILITNIKIFYHKINSLH
jgi:hypothetical protein